MKQMSPVLLLLALALAGCGAKGGNGAFHADASDPVLMAPPSTPLYGYDGTGMAAGTGTMTVHTSNADNKGYVAVDFTAGGHHYQVNWTDFHIQPGATWQDGGIACGPGLVEHGASGHGNKMEPQFDLDCGGWGTTSAMMDGKPLTDPVTGATTFNAHYMVTQESMMEQGTMKVYKADGKTPFDPHTPGDGHVFAGRKEAHFAFWGAGAYKDGIAVQPPKPTTTWVNDTATGAVPPAPSYSKSVPFPVAAVQTTVHLHLDLAAAPSPPGQVSLTLLDPQGQAVTGFTVSPIMPSRDLDAPALKTAGNYTLRIDAQGAQVAYHAAATQTPPVPLLVHVVFTRVTEG